VTGPAGVTGQDAEAPDGLVYDDCRTNGIPIGQVRHLPGADPMVSSMTTAEPTVFQSVKCATSPVQTKRVEPTRSVPVEELICASWPSQWFPGETYPGIQEAFFSRSRFTRRGGDSIGSPGGRGAIETVAPSGHPGC